MSKHIQLSIPTPCHENWDNMTPVEKGKFCGSCQKQVIDFSNMSDREVAQFFKKPSTGSVCGRFMQDQLDRSIEIPKKRIPWLKYFFQFALPAFLVSMKGYSQKEGRLMGKVAPTCILPVMGDTGVTTIKEQNIDTGDITGKVIDEMGNPISSASVVIKGTKIGSVTDSNGQFSIKENLRSKDILLVVSAIGFQTQEIGINANNLQKIILIKSELQLSGEVVVFTGFVSVKKIRPELINVPLLAPSKDTAIKLFNVYPNPLNSNTSLNIECKQPEAGTYLLQLFNASGQLTFVKEIWVDDEARLLNMQLPSVAAGNYFLKMTNKKSGKSYTEKIIIQ